MRYELSEIAQLGVFSGNFAGTLANKLVTMLARHPHNTHTKLGNVELKHDKHLTYIKCTECGKWHPIFFRDNYSNLYYSGPNIPCNHTFRVIGNIWIGYDIFHHLSACCERCRHENDILRCPICSTFHQTGYTRNTRNLMVTRNANGPYGGYTIHGYDNDDDYDTYDHCCRDCRQVRLDGDTDYQYDTCERCGDIFLSDDMYWCDDDGCFYCEDCYSERQAEIEAENCEDDDCDAEWHEIDLIEDYHANNHIQRDLGNSLMFGAEYEIKCFDLYDDTYDRERFCEGLSNYGAITRDASVDLEIVTKPMTLPDLKENILNLAEYCSKHHVKAWNGGFCGLHIHINRGGIRNFTNIYHFLDEYKTELHTLSGREFTSSATHYCQFDFPAGDDELLEECNRYTRYLAVNLENEKTIEFRFFRNTTKKERIEAYFDFLKVLFENDNDLDKMTWEDLIRKTDNDFLYDMFNISKQYPLPIAE